jgi:hypothetical protein
MNWRAKLIREARAAAIEAGWTEQPEDEVYVAYDWAGTLARWRSEGWKPPKDEQFGLKTIYRPM